MTLNAQNKCIFSSLQAAHGGRGGGWTTARAAEDTDKPAAFPGRYGCGDSAFAGLGGGGGYFIIEVIMLNMQMSWGQRGRRLAAGERARRRRRGGAAEYGRVRGLRVAPG